MINYFTSHFKLLLFFGFLFTSTADLVATNTEAAFAIYCPDDVIVDCNDELWDLSIYGDAYVETYAGQESAGTPEVTYNLSSCNTGYIYRTWTVEDYNWNLHSCTQTISVHSTEAFTEDNITWPGETIELEGCNLDISPENMPEGYDKPYYDWAECSMVGVSYKDRTFTISPTCKKVLRKWQVMDWCQYDVNTNYGLWTWYQTIKISNGEIPEPNFPPDTTFNSYNCQNALVQLDPIIVDGDACGGIYTVTNNSPYADSTGYDISGVYPIGVTKVNVQVHYGCGKKVSKTVEITVLNKKAPHVYCYAELVTVLMPTDEDQDGIIDNGMVEVWAKDLDKGSKAACNGGPIKYSFTEDPDDSVLVFTCDDVGKNVVRMYVTDYKGSQAYCNVNLIIQNNGGNIPNCEPPIEMPEDSISLFGRVTNIYNKKINDVEIKIEEMNPVVEIFETIDTSYELIEETKTNASGAEITIWYYDSVFTTTYDTVITQQLMNNTSDGNGYFSFDSCMIKGKDYMIDAQLADFSKTGITEKDVKLLEMYVDGKIEFANPVLLHVADIDQNGEINQVDADRLRAFVEGEISILNEDISWLFFAYADNEMDNMLPDFMLLENLDNVLHNINFIAAKLGDLNSDAQVLQTEGDLVSDILVSHRSLGLDEVRISPNPFSDRVNISLKSETDRISKFTAFGSTGKVIHEETLDIKKGSNELSVQIFDNYKGLIYYQITTDENILNSGKLIKI